MSGHPLSRDNCKAAAWQGFVLDGRQYALGGNLGDGAVGLVRKATRSEDGKLVAVKFSRQTRSTLKKLCSTTWPLASNERVNEERSSNIRTWRQHVASTRAAERATTT